MGTRGWGYLARSSCINFFRKQNLRHLALQPSYLPNGPSGKTILDICILYTVYSMRNLYRVQVQGSGFKVNRFTSNPSIIFINPSHSEPIK